MYNDRYHPLAWATGHSDYRSVHLHGGHLYLFSDDDDDLFDEIKRVRPTKLKGVPIIWNKYYSDFIYFATETMNE